MSFPPDLLEKVNAIMKDSGSKESEGLLRNDKINREILYWERILRVSKIDIPFSVGLSDLILKTGKKIPLGLGPHSYSCDLYKLSWEKNGKDHYGLFIENIKLHRKFSLGRSPYWIREVMAPLLEVFSLVFSEYLERIEKGLEICGSIPRNQSLFQ